MAKRKKCKCGSEQFLIQSAWYNAFKKPTWICAAKSCRYRKLPRLSPERLLKKLMRQFFYEGNKGIEFSYIEGTSIAEIAGKGFEDQLKTFL